MEKYLRRGKIGGWMDDLGLRGLIVLAAFLWFAWLWGVGMPSLLAGLALGLLGQMTLTRYRQHTVMRREKALRHSLGGEMLLEEMLYISPQKAHMQAALLLAQKYPLTLESMAEDGARCRYQGKLLLVHCLQRTAGTEAMAEDALQLMRAARRELADKVILCLMCKASSGLRAYAECSAIPIRIISRETMQALAGQARPATDEQLVELGKRKKSPGTLAKLRAAVLHKDRAGRYMFYGTAMLMIYILTGAAWYAVPGALTVCLGACSRYASRGKETL